MRLKRSGKTLAGAQPRRGGRWLKQNREPLQEEARLPILAMLFLGLFGLGIVGGFAWGADRQIRGGVLRQRAEAERRPDWVYLENLPRYVPDALISVTQPSLLSRGALRPEEDGRTLARELVQQVHLLPSSLLGEARGLVMGPVLERRISDRDLMELYLNRVHLGESRGYPLYGLHAAAREYFGKEPTELTVSETATLAGLLLEPRLENPEQQVGPAGTRRNEVLRVLLDAGLISEEQFRQALAEPLGFQPGLDQLPFSRPANWGERESVIRLPPNLRPMPVDSTAAES